MALNLVMIIRLFCCFVFVDEGEEEEDGEEDEEEKYLKTITTKKNLNFPFFIYTNYSCKLCRYFYIVDYFHLSLFLSLVYKSLKYF